MSLCADDERDEDDVDNTTKPYGHDYSRHIPRHEELPLRKTVTIATNTSPTPEQWRMVDVTPAPPPPPEQIPMTYLERLWTTGTVREY